MKKIILIFIFLTFFSSNLCCEENTLVDIRQVIPSIIVDLKYSTNDNFMQEDVYDFDVCLLRYDVALRLKSVQHDLSSKGVGLKIYDGYRPLSVQRKMFERFGKTGYVANPDGNPNHCRGAAVDVGLIDFETGKELSMPSSYDEFSSRSHIYYKSGTEEQRDNRDLLLDTMVKHGFVPFETEWWHYSDPGAESFEIIDIIPGKE
jgi:D-alanyl-D-alanine dipeptidase